MATRRAALAAGAALPAALVAASAAGASEAECNAPLSGSFELVQDWEVEDVSREIFGVPSKDGWAGSSSVEIRELGNGWLAAEDAATTRSVLALGRDLATDPRVQAAVMERVHAGSFKAPSKLLEELKLVLVAREVKADGTNETTPTLSRHSSAATAEPATEEAHAEEAHAESAEKQHARAAGAADTARGAEQPADEPSLGAALLEAALVIASVIILTAVARRLNPKACTLAAAALAGAWGALFGGFKTSAAARGK